MSRLAAILVLLAVTTPPPPLAWAQEPARTTATGRKDREKRAEADFMAARYQEAADLLDGLYAEFKNPVYLRNLGRCHQRLKHPDQAIAAFEEYLRIGKNITPAERDEVQGFIRDMQELKRQQEPVAAPPPPPPPIAVTPAPSVVPPLVAPPTATITETAAVAPPSPPHRTGKVVGASLLGAAALMAAGGGIMLAESWSEYHHGQSLGCPGDYECTAIANKVNDRALWGKILFGGAAAAGIAGGVVLWMSYSPAEPGHAGNAFNVALRGRF